MYKIKDQYITSSDVKQLRMSLRIAETCRRAAGARCVSRTVTQYININAGAYYQTNANNVVWN